MPKTVLQYILTIYCYSRLCLLATIWTAVTKFN